jgi:hypothetical protein
MMSNVDDSPGPADATLRGLAPGQLIAGRFRLERILGRGGMGVVWQAHDESLKETVAFKFLAETLVHDDAALFDLKREVRRSRQLTHAHIIRVHDLIEDRERGVAGIAMEMAGGGTLSARRVTTRFGWFEPDQIKDWVRELCEALDYAHKRAHVVHRDLKPSNLLLSAADELKIADFGISAGLLDSRSRLSGVGTSGTPAYMSPQQARGLTPTTSDDLYSLGATLYDLLTGKPPFPPGSTSAAGRVPLSMSERRRELEEIDAPVPLQWEGVVRSLLTSRPEERPSSAMEVVELLGLRSGIERRENVDVRTAGMQTVSRWPIHIVRRLAPRRSWWALGVFVAARVIAIAWRGVVGVSDPTPPTSESRAEPAQGREALIPRNIRLRIGSRVIHRRFSYQLEGPFGIIDGAGSLVAKPSWEKLWEIDATETLIPVSLGPEGTGKWGIIDRDGRIVAAPEWDAVRRSSEGLIAVRRGSDAAARWEFIDETGNRAVHGEYEDADSFVEGLARVKKNGKYGYIGRTGAFAVAPIWDDGGHFFGGIALVHRSGKWGVIDRAGKVTVEPQWDDVKFWGGWEFPTVTGLNATIAIKQASSGKWGIVDTHGRTIVLPEWDQASPFVEGLAEVARGNRRGFIDRTGRLIGDLEWLNTWWFREGMGIVQLPNGRWTFVTTTGKSLGSTWEDIDKFIGFRLGVAAVREAGKWGLIDKTGHIVLATEWDGIDTMFTSPFRLLYKKLTADTALVAYVDGDLKEVWRAELPLVEDSK